MRRVRDEQGATAIIVAVSLVALIAMLMLVVDAGNLWQTRRTAVTATDAAALNAGREAAINGPGGACAGYQAVLQRNAGADVQPISCTVAAGSTIDVGSVTVEASKPSAVRFGGLFGIGDSAAYASSSVQWGFITRTRGLRPIGICVADDHMRGFLGIGSDNGQHPSPGVHRITYTKDSPNDCGANAPGNWGFMDFNGGSNSNAEFVDWMRTGYDNEVGVDDCNGDGTPGDRCEANTGSGGNSYETELQALMDSGEEFSVAIYDSVQGTGAGVTYNIYGFLGVRLVGFRVTGAENRRYFDFEFQRLTRPGNCCFSTGRSTGVVGMRLCSIDHDPVATATRCS